MILLLSSPYLYASTAHCLKYVENTLTNKNQYKTKEYDQFKNNNSKNNVFTSYLGALCF